MKTFAAGLAAAYASGSSTLCQCLRVLRQDAAVVTFTSHDQDLIVGSEAYLAATGLDLTELAIQAGLGVDNLEISVFPDDISYPQVDIIAGRWDRAKFWLFECDYSDTGLASGVAIGTTRTDVNLLRRGTTGESDTLRVSNRFEFRSLKQALQQSLGEVTSKTCRARLGDERCTLDIADWTFDYTVTAVASRHVFTCSAAVEAADFYGEGVATGLTGNNAGFSQKVRSFASGVFTLSLSMPFSIQIGDTFRFIAGDRKRREDCRDKFSNILNFQGEPDVPGADILTADPDIGGT